MECLQTTELTPVDTDAAIILASARGARLAATRAPGRFGPVVLAHGFGQTRESWIGTQAKLTAAGFGSLSFDMRGHGRSTWNRAGEDYSAEDFVADQRTAAIAAGHQPILVGASMGGLTALLAQARHQLYSALVLVDVTPRWEAAGVERIQGFMRAHPGGFADAEHAAQAIADYLPHRSTRKTPAQLATVLRNDGAGRLRWHWDPRLLDIVSGDTARQQADLAIAARSIRIPTLLISGSESDIVSSATIDEFLVLVPHAKHVSVPRATHMLVGDRNDAFTDAVLKFIQPLRENAADSLGVRP